MDFKNPIIWRDSINGVEALGCRIPRCQGSSQECQGTKGERGRGWEGPISEAWAARHGGGNIAHHPIPNKELLSFISFNIT